MPFKIFFPTSVSKTCLVVFVGCFLLSCNDSPQVTPAPVESEEVINQISVRNEEIRKDILAEMASHNIEYWINDDNSIGFPVADAETVDQIWYEVIGAYASRN